MSGDQWCIHSGQSVNPELPASLPEATRHSQGGQIVPQIVEAEVFDPGTLFCLAPCGRALLDALAAEGETPARVLSPRGFQRRHGVRVQRNAAPVARLRRAVIEPGHFPVQIHAAPFEPPGSRPHDTPSRAQTRRSVSCGPAIPRSIDPPPRVSRSAHAAAVPSASESSAPHGAIASPGARYSRSAELPRGRDSLSRSIPPSFNLRSRMNGCNTVMSIASSFRDRRYGSSFFR